MRVHSNGFSPARMSATRSWAPATVTGYNRTVHFFTGLVDAARQGSSLFSRYLSGNCPAGEYMEKTIEFIIIGVYLVFLLVIGMAFAGSTRTSAIFSAAARGDLVAGRFERFHGGNQRLHLHRASGVAYTGRLERGDHLHRQRPRFFLNFLFLRSLVSAVAGDHQSGGDPDALRCGYPAVLRGFRRADGGVSAAGCSSGRWRFSPRRFSASRSGR
jgi:hypothetical protein